jgi:iron transport multicopper oxidase
MRFVGANEMDGAVGITQCAISPTANFTYKSEITIDQSGTFWYIPRSVVKLTSDG